MAFKVVQVMRFKDTGKWYETFGFKVPIQLSDFEAKNYVRGSQDFVNDDKIWILTGEGLEYNVPVMLTRSRDVEKQENIVVILYDFLRSQKNNEPTSRAEDGLEVYNPEIGEALEKIMKIFGLEVTPID